MRLEGKVAVIVGAGQSPGEGIAPSNYIATRCAALTSPERRHERLKSRNYVADAPRGKIDLNQRPRVFAASFCVVGKPPPLSCDLAHRIAELDVVWADSLGHSLTSFCVRSALFG